MKTLKYLSDITLINGNNYFYYCDRKDTGDSFVNAVRPSGRFKTCPGWVLQLRNEENKSESRCIIFIYYDSTVSGPHTL